MSALRRVVGIAIVLTSLFLLTGSRLALGQAVFGNIVGTVTDASGAAVPNADVSIRDLDRGVSYQTKSNADGNYTQTHLLAGHYEVKVTAPSFSELIATAEVQVDATTRVDAQLQVGKTTSTVTVTGETPLLKTERADVSNTLGADELHKLPILDRNLTTLVLALPGTEKPPTLATAGAENPQGDIETPSTVSSPTPMAFFSTERRTTATSWGWFSSIPTPTPWKSSR
jgi:hypothetical protein